MSGRKLEPSFLYGDAERAIGIVLNIMPERMGALRARLRHLRNLGLPKLPRPGSGRKIRYSYNQIFEMCVAAALGHSGLGPRSAILAASKIKELFQRERTMTGENIYVLIQAPDPANEQEAEDFDAGLANESNMNVLINFAHGREQLFENLMDYTSQLFRAAFFMDLSGLASDLEEALGMVAADG